MPHDAFYLSDLLPAGSPELAGEKLSALPESLFGGEWRGVLA